MKRLIYVFLLPLLLGSCSLLDEGPLPECPRSAGDFTLSFTVDASEQGMLSRTDDLHDEVDPEYRNFENGIDLDDLAVYVFARMAGAADEKLIFSTVDLGAAGAGENVEVSGGAGIYTVKLLMDKKEFEEKVGAKMDAEDSERVSFRVLMISGATLLDAAGAYDMSQWEAVTADTYAGVIDAMTGPKWAFPMADLMNTAPGTGNNITDIYPGRRKYIPMFGTNTFSVSQYALVNSAPGREAYLGGIDMLRSVAKVRVIDNIINKNDDGYPRITGVSFRGCQSALRVIPAGAKTYVNGTQVHTASLADDGADHGQGASSCRMGIIPRAWTNIAEDECRGDIFAGYAPEMEITAHTSLPYFSINVALRKNADGTEETNNYPVALADFADFGTYILRNHVYTLSVERVNLNELSLDVAVNEWKTLKFEYEY